MTTEPPINWKTFFEETDGLCFQAARSIKGARGLGYLETIYQAFKARMLEETAMGQHATPPTAIDTSKVESVELTEFLTREQAEQALEDAVTASEIPVLKPNVEGSLEEHLKGLAIFLGKPLIRTSYPGPEAHKLTVDEYAFEIGKVEIGAALGLIEATEIKDIDSHLPKIRFDAPFAIPEQESPLSSPDAAGAGLSEGDKRELVDIGDDDPIGDAYAKGYAEGYKAKAIAVEQELLASRQPDCACPLPYCVMIPEQHIDTCPIVMPAKRRAVTLSEADKLDLIEELGLVAHKAIPGGPAYEDQVRARGEAVMTVLLEKFEIRRRG